MTIIYGIKNCDSVKKAVKWLDDNQVSYQFHDFKKNGLSSELLEQFVSLSDWQILLNKRSTTYRQLPEELKNNLSDEAAFEAVLAQPTLLKRPLLAYNNSLFVGFKTQQFQEIFS